MAQSISSHEENGAKPKSIWPLVLLALFISIVWAGGYLVTNIASLSHPDGTPFGDGRAIGSWIGSATVPALVTWIAFHFLAFRKHGLKKSLAAMAILLIATPAIVVAPFLALLGDVRASDAVQRELATATETNLAALNQRFQSDITELQLPADVLGEIENPSDVDVALERLQRVRALFERQITAVDEELSRTRQSITSAELSEEQKQRAQDAIDVEVGSQSLMRRSVATASTGLESAQALLLFLQANKHHWTKEDGQFVFDDEETLEQFNTLAARHNALQQELATLQRELSASQTAQ